MESIGPFQIAEEIGRGAMGVVFRGFDPAIGRPVAIKVIRSMHLASAAENAETRLRFAREAVAAGKLSHPNIVTIYHMGDFEGSQYMAMELVNGSSLDHLLEPGVPMEIETTLAILSQVADALDYAHTEGVVHRDIKPANILVRPNGKVKITDFGIARISSQTVTKTGMTMGTPAYMAPEQIMAARVDGKADQFSLAVMAFQMLIGQRPFDADTDHGIMFKIVSEEPPPIHTLNPQIPPSVTPTLGRALAKDSSRRYATCTEFVQALKASIRARVVEEPTVRLQNPLTVLAVDLRSDDTRQPDNAALRCSKDGEVSASLSPADPFSPAQAAIPTHEPRQRGVTLSVVQDRPGSGFLQRPALYVILGAFLAVIFGVAFWFYPRANRPKVEIPTVAIVNMILEYAGGTQRVPTTYVAPDSAVFNGASVLLGRTLVPGDYRANARVAVVSALVWKQRFRRDPSVLGRTIHLNNNDYTVVGVIAESFRTEPPADVFLPKPNLPASPTSEPSVENHQNPKSAAILAKPAILSFKAEPPTIEAGQFSTLRWEIEDTTEVSIDPDPGSRIKLGKERSWEVLPAYTTTYTMTARGAGGTTRSSVKVNVTAPSMPVTTSINKTRGKTCEARDASGRCISVSEPLARSTEDAFFDFDKSNIRPDARVALAHSADTLKAVLADYPNAKFVMEGHTDDREGPKRNRAEYDLGLGDRRATAARNFLIRLGVPSEQLKTVSYGRERPVCTEAAEDCWQKNRRVHFVLAQ
jgi:serine/threonine protein kinase/outer membrane protein OmpA-like peptidoglycan-associated protein